MWLPCSIRHETSDWDHKFSIICHLPTDLNTITTYWSLEKQLVWGLLPRLLFSDPRLCLYLCSHSYCMKANLLPSSGRWQSSRWWQTTCGPWYHWLHSWGCQSAWSGPLAANFSTDLSGLSWSGKESEPANHRKQSESCSECVLRHEADHFGGKCLIVTFLT